MSDYKIYVADLAAYNNGILRGVWIDVLEDDIQDRVNVMLEDSPIHDAEEWAIHDYEGFEGVSISEYDSFESIHALASFLDEHEEFGAALLSYWCGDIEEAKQAMEEQYAGCYASLADFAQSLTEETTEIPSHLEFYIDYERMGRDFEMSGDIFFIEISHNEVHIFYAR